MARAGANVVVNYNSHREDGEEVAESVRSLGGEAIVVQADVSDRAAVDDAGAFEAKPLDPVAAQDFDRSGIEFEMHPFLPGVGAHGRKLLQGGQVLLFQPALPIGQFAHAIR